MPGESDEPGPWGELPLVDYLLGAAAQHTASAVLHYDRDFDTLAEIMDFDSVWLAPAGSIP